MNVSPALFDLGAEEHRVEGQGVRVYRCRARGRGLLPVQEHGRPRRGPEALAEAWRSKRLNFDELNRIAKPLGVQRVMQPYLEMLVT